MNFFIVCLLLLGCLNGVVPPPPPPGLPPPPAKFVGLFQAVRVLLDDGRDIVRNAFSGEEFRPFNGFGNNVNHPTWGNTNANVTRCLPPVYGDGKNTLTGLTRPNPRELSNVISNIVDEESLSNINDRHLTQWAWQWGQFIDHDVTLISEDKSDDDLNDDIDIVVPCGDPVYDEKDQCDGSIHITMFRTIKAGDENIQPTVENPRNQFNDITSFIDGSQVYGNTKERADELRLGALGRMKVSTDSSGTEVLLPYNTFGLLNEIDESEKFFVGGDVRVTEQPGLLLIHTIFVRLHNRIARHLYPEINDDEKTYQTTRAIVTGIIEKITYYDWLPTLFGEHVFEQFIQLTPSGIAYDSNVDPGVCAIFSSAAFRLGHTLLPFKLPLRDSNCQYVFEKGRFSSNDNDVILKDGFFRPDLFANNKEFPNSLLQGLACTKASEVDVLITSSVRNFLFEFIGKIDPQAIPLPFDLMALNLNRGRDHGLPDYNSVRQQLGLTKRTSFNEITSDSDLAHEIQEIYGRDIDNVDLIIGLLAEDHLEDSSFGETISHIILNQFNRILVGDRYYFERYLRTPIVAAIKQITLQDVIEFSSSIPFGTFNSDILDVNNNIFQNTRARSIFQNVPCAKNSPCQRAQSTHHVHSFSSAQEAAAGKAVPPLSQNIKIHGPQQQPPLSQTFTDFSTLNALKNFSQWMKLIGIISSIVIFVLFTALFITCRGNKSKHGYKSISIGSGAATSVVE